MKTQLTKEQSQHLIELGFPKWKVQEIKPSDVSLNDWTPTITLTDLLEILPKEIEITEGCKDTLVIDFIDGSVYAQYTFQSRTRQESDELIDSLYDLCVWCLENKIIKPGSRNTRLCPQ